MFDGADCTNEFANDVLAIVKVVVLIWIRGQILSAVQLPKGPMNKEKNKTMEVCHHDRRTHLRI
jgi:hypothetical protein